LLGAVSSTELARPVIIPPGRDRLCAKPRRPIGRNASTIELGAARAARNGLRRTTTKISTFNFASSFRDRVIALGARALGEPPLD